MLIICTLCIAACVLAAVLFSLNRLLQPLGENRHVQEELLRENKTLKKELLGLRNDVASLKSLLGSVTERLNDLTKRNDCHSPAYANVERVNYGDTQPLPSKNKPSTAKKQEKELGTDLKKSFYARAYDEGDKMIVVENNSENASATSPFVVDTFGNTGRLRFNTASFAHNIENAEVLVSPFCYVEMLAKNSPSAIENVSDGEVKLQGNDWIITSKPRIKVI